MPILERDPWRLQYFEGVDCPEGLVIPTEDGDAYALYPRHRWIYNKLTICETQGMVHGLHGMEPPSFPVFSKPIYNMRGMGAGSRPLRSLRDYQTYQRPGHMWMPLLDGEHVSSDVAVVDGEPRWWRHVTGLALPGGMFDHWTVRAGARPAIEAYCGEWLRRHMRGYSGIVNFETIGARIIEAHLRFSDQWPDLYGEGWLKALVRLYADGVWVFADEGRRDGYSVVLFGAHGIQYAHPDPAVLDELRADPAISSVQVTFHADKLAQAHSMPPGGFRLAIVNTWDLEVGLAARQKLAPHFWSAQRIVPKRGRRLAAVS